MKTGLYVSPTPPPESPKTARYRAENSLNLAGVQNAEKRPFTPVSAMCLMTSRGLPKFARLTDSSTLSHSKPARKSMSRISKASG